MTINNRKVIFFLSDAFPGERKGITYSGSIGKTWERLKKEEGIDEKETFTLCLSV